MAGGAALMHQNCLPEGKMSNRSLSGLRGPAAVFSLPFSLLCHPTGLYTNVVMEAECQSANLSTPQLTSCDVEKRQRHNG